MKKREPKAQKPTEYQPPKPLWRFGWGVWLLLPIAITLTIIYFTGYDLRTPLLTLIAERLGIPALYWFVSKVISGNFLALGYLPPAPIFTVLGAWCVLVGVAVHPRRFGLRRDAAMLFIGITAPTLWLTVHSIVQSWFPPRGHTPDPWVTTLGTFTSQSTITLLGALAVFLLFRARLVALVILLVGLLGAWISIEYSWSLAGGELLLPTTTAWLANYWTGWLFNPAILAAALYWAVSARRAYKPDWACQSCGYDLRATPTDPCPECGTTRGTGKPEPAP